MPSLGVNNASKFSRPTFNPTATPDLLHWWRSDKEALNGSGVQASDGEGVWKWTSQVVGDDSVAYVDDTSIRPPFNGAENAIVFNGTLKRLSLDSDITLSAEGGFFILCRIKFASTPNTTDILLKDPDDDNMILYLYDATTIKIKLGTAGASGNYEFAVPTMGTSDYYNIAIACLGGGSGRLHCYLDNVESTTGGKPVQEGDESFVFDTIKGGHADYLRTLMVFNGFLNTRDRADLHEWLRVRGPLA